MRELPHLQPEQVRLWTAHCLCRISVLLIEGVAALVQGVYLSFTLRLVIVVLLYAVWGECQRKLSLGMVRHTLNGTLQGNS